MSSKQCGTVKWFHSKKGYGFIVNEDGEDVMVHHRSIMLDGYRQLNEGQEVMFVQVRSERGWQAAEVEIL